MKHTFFILALIGLVSTPAFAEEHKTKETRKDTYSESHPNVKRNGCPENEHVDERHQCVKNLAK